MQDTFKHIEEAYGGVNAYLDRIGFDADDRQKLKEALGCEVRPDFVMPRSTSGYDTANQSTRGARALSGGQASLQLTAVDGGGSEAGYAFAVGSRSSSGGGGGGNDAVLPPRGGYFNATGKVGWCSEDLDFTTIDPMSTKHVPGTIAKHKVGFTQVWV